MYGGILWYWKIFPVKNTFVAYIDISGFKAEMKKDKKKSIKILMIISRG